MSFLSDVEARITDAVHTVVSDVQGAEPTVEAAAANALRDVGAPEDVAGAVHALLVALSGHFNTLAAKAQEALAATAAPESVEVPSATTAP